jgi:hypothetical protein
MLRNLFESTVSALCYEIGASQRLNPPFNDVARFVIRQHARMPRLLGYGVQAATLWFSAAALARHGALFHRLPPPRRHVQVDAWTHSRLTFCRDLMRFYSSLAIMALYSRP